MNNQLKEYKNWLAIKKDQLMDGILADKMGTTSIGWAPYNAFYTLRIIREMLAIQKEYFERFSSKLTNQSTDESEQIVSEISHCIDLYDEMKSLWDANKIEASGKKQKEFFDYYCDHIFNWFD